MNSSSASDVASTVRGCEPVIPQGTLDHTNTEACGWLIFTAVFSIITCPVTTVLNALVIIAVKTQHRLKTNTNIALACLSTTDLAMGVLGQPIFIATVIAALQGITSSLYCRKLTLIASIISRILASVSLSHLAMMNAERYIAIKHPMQYETIVSKNRLMCLSAVLWIIELPLTAPLSMTDSKIYLRIDLFLTSFCIATTIFCQVMLYYETIRHKKQIANQQVSLEAKEKFLKEKKAFKLTATVLFSLIVCYLPFIVARTLTSNSIITSVNVAYIAIFTGRAGGIFNPVIYCVRIRTFRVAFVQLLLRKSSTEADNIEKRVFGRSNRLIPLQEGSNA